MDERDNRGRKKIEDFMRVIMFLYSIDYLS